MAHDVDASRRPPLYTRQSTPSLPLLLLAGFLAIVGFFNFVDPYHSAFFGTRYVFVYNVLRLALTGYLLFIIYAAGSLLFTWLFGSQPRSLSRLSYFLVCIFGGVGAWHVYMLAIGQISLLYEAMVLVPAVLLIVIKGNDLCLLEAHLRQSAIANWKAASPAGRAVFVFAILTCATTFFLMTLAKGLYPGGGHDYWLHYFYYFDFSLDAHSTLPNRAWYHYFYSKGMGITFLAMLLSDPLGGQLAGLLFVSVGVAVFYEMVRRMGANINLALLGSAIIFLFYISTPGVGEIAQNGGWGQFQKNHGAVSVLIFGLVWICAELAIAPGDVRRIWTGTAILLVVGLGIASIQGLLIAGLFTALMLLAAVLRRNWSLAVAFFTIGVASAVMLIAGFGLNYIATGVPSDQYIVELWPLVHFDTLENHNILANAVLVHQANTGQGQIASKLISTEFLDLLYNSFYIYLLMPMIAGTVATFILAAVFGCLRHLRMSLSLPLLLIIGSTLVAAAVAGPRQSISFSRYTEFTIFVGMALSLGLLATLPRLAAIDPMRFGAGGGVARALPYAILLLTGTLAIKSNEIGISKGVANGFRFFAGEMSIYDGFKRQTEAGTFSFGAINPAAEGAWQVLGRGTKIWSFNIHTYCQLPSCDMESFASMRTVPRFEDLYYGSPDAAKTALQADGVNYFLYVKSLAISSDLPYVSLFSKANISKYLGIKWTDGDGYLLTWLTEDTKPLSSSWVNEFSSHVSNNAIPSEAFSLLQRELSKRPAGSHYGYEWPLNWDKGN